MWLRFLVLSIVSCLCQAVSLFQEPTDIERRIQLGKNFNLDSLDDCWKESMEKPSKESDESSSEEIFLENNSLREMRGTRKVNRTLYNYDSVKRVGRSGKKKKRYQLLATAAIAAKAASVATALTILLPLALKFITFLAIKSFFVGTVAVLMTSFLGFTRMVQESPEQKTVVYLHKPQQLH